MSKHVREMLLSGWEEVYKKSQLTLWILLALKEGEKTMSGIKGYIQQRTHALLDADDASMYRALRRFDEADLIRATVVPSTSGPDMKMWHITETGSWVLEKFITRNIRGILLDPENKSLFT